MRLTVKRIRQGKNSTMSEIYLDDDFFCYGLEDLVRKEKIKGSTAIPAGRYPLRLNTYGGMNARYKRKFPTMHRGMIEIEGIPNFKYVYIHIGNNFGDTAGCLLVGDFFAYQEDDFELRKSKSAYVRLYKLLIEAVKRGEVELIIDG